MMAHGDFGIVFSRNTRNQLLAVAISVFVYSRSASSSETDIISISCEGEQRGRKLPFYTLEVGQKGARSVFSNRRDGELFESVE